MKISRVFVQDVSWTFTRRSEDTQDVFWTSYVRSVYVLCPGRWYNDNPFFPDNHGSSRYSKKKLIISDNYLDGHYHISEKFPRALLPRDLNTRKCDPKGLDTDEYIF